MKIIATGQKNGQRLTLTYEDGLFSKTGNKTFDREILELITKPLRLGGTQSVNPFEPLRGRYVMYEFFDELEDIEYVGGPEPKLEFKKGMIY